MPSIELYLGPDDGALILDWLRTQSEIRFTTRPAAEGPRLGDPPPSLEEGRYALFHASYPRLPVRPADSPRDRSLTRELYRLMRAPPPSAPPRPDENHPSIFILTIDYSARALGPDPVGLSSLGWIGGRYESEGRTVTPQARSWWRRCRRWIAARSERVSRFGPLAESSRRLSAYAFPQALEMLKAGAPRATNVGD